MQSAMVLVYKFADWLQIKFNLKFATIIIRIGSLAVGVSDVEFNQHYKRKDFGDISRADMVKELAKYNDIEKILNGENA